MDQWVNVAMRVDPVLANKIVQDGSVELATRLADGKFDSITKVAIKKDKKNKSVLNALRKEKSGPIEPVAVMALLKGSVVLGTIKGISGFISSLFLLPNMKMLLKKLDEISDSVSSVKKLSYLNTGLGLVNLGVDVAGFVYIGNRLNDVQKSIELISSQVGQIKSILTSEKISDYHKLSLKFGAVSTRLGDGDTVSRNEIEGLLIDMQTFISEMIRNFYYDAMDAEIILEIVFNLLAAYSALLNIYVQDYYFEKGRFPDNLETYRSLYLELVDDRFSKLVEDCLIIKKGLTITEAINAIQVQKLLVANCMLQNEDQIDILRLVETKDQFLSLTKITNKYIENKVAQLTPKVEEKTGVSDCQEIIYQAIGEQLAI